MQVEGLIGKKKEMSQVFKPDGKVVPVTILEVGPCVITQIKTQEKDGYSACQLGFGNTKPKLLKKPQAGHFKNIKQKPRILREFYILEGENGELNIGQKITLDQVFKEGETVQIIGGSKGKGFAGVVKRWGFHGGPKTHGQSDRHRAPGSIGGTTDPGRVFRGKKMAGRMGGGRVTVKGLEVVEVNKKDNIMKVSGPVPGHRDSVVVIKKLIKGGSSN